MGQFFTKENVENFFQDNRALANVKMDPQPLLAIVDFDAIFERLKGAVLSSPFGGMLGMFGGAKALEPLRGPFRTNIEGEIRTLVESPKLMDALRGSVHSENGVDVILEKVDAIVQKRLDELTPLMVKQIIQEMIREHLGWLVVWGGIFGALIGLVASFIA